MTTYVCTELAPANSGYIACKQWAVSPPQLADSLAITKADAIALATPIIALLLMVKCYKMAVYAIKSI